MAQKVMILGRIGNDLELKDTKSGKKYINFSLAVNEYAGKDESGKSQYKAEWIDCVAWEKTAELIFQYTSKGHRLYIEGKITSNTVESPDGKKTKYTKIRIDTVEFIEKKNENGNTDAGTVSDDMPF